MQIQMNYKVYVLKEESTKCNLTTDYVTFKIISFLFYKALYYLTWKVTLEILRNVMMAVTVGTTKELIM